MKFIIVFFSAYIAFSTLAQDASQIFFEKKLGEQAFASEDYDSAIHYYKNFIANSKDNIERIKVSKRIIEILLLQKDIKEAQLQLNKVKNQLDNIEIKFFTAEIHRVSQNYNKAIIIYNEVKSQTTGPLASKALAGIAFSYIKQKNWTQAIISYSILENTSKQYKAFATRQKIYAMIKADNIKNANMCLTNISQNIRNKYSQDFDIFKIIVLLNQKKLKESDNLYNKILHNSQKEKGQLISWCSEVYADTLLQDLDTKKKNLEKIELLYKKSIQTSVKERENQRLTYKLINVYINNNLNNKAIDAIKHFIKSYSKNKEIIYLKMQLARLYAKNHNIELAYKAYKNLLAIENLAIVIKFEVSKELGNLYATNKQYKDAINAFYYIIKNSKKDALKDRDFAYLSIARLYNLDKNTEKSLNNLDNIINNTVESLTLKIALLKQLKQNQMIIDTANIFLREFPTSHSTDEILYEKANALLNTGKDREGLSMFLNISQKYSKKPTAPKALFNAGKIYFNLNNYYKTISTYQDFSRKYPTHILVPNALYKISHAYFMLDDTANAIKAAEKLYQRFPKSEYGKNIYFWLAEYYSNIGQSEEALNILDKMMKIYSDEETKSLILLKKAQLLFLINKVDESIAIIDEIEQKFPNTLNIVKSFILKGNIFSQQGFYEKALKSYKNASKKAKNVRDKYNILVYIGDMQYSLGTRDNNEDFLNKAIMSYQMIVKLKPTTEKLKDKIYYRLGVANEKKNDIVTALTEYNRVIYLYPIYKEQGMLPSKVWFVKSLQAVIRINQGIATVKSKKLANKALEKLKKVNKNFAKGF